VCYGEGKICSGFLRRRLLRRSRGPGSLGEHCVRAIRIDLLLAEQQALPRAGRRAGTWPLGRARKRWKSAGAIWNGFRSLACTACSLTDSGGWKDGINCLDCQGGARVLEADVYALSQQAGRGEWACTRSGVLDEPDDGEVAAWKAGGNLREANSFEVIECQTFVKKLH